MTCKCEDEFNKRVKAKNTKLSIALVFGSNKSTFIVSTVKLDPRSKVKPVTALATFCPFCGVKI